MDSFSWACINQRRFWGHPQHPNLNWNWRRWVHVLAFLSLLLLLLRSLLLSTLSGYYHHTDLELPDPGGDDGNGIRRDKFLEVPQIVWGLNNQKIALARACLTARFLNRTLLMPSLSASLFYKEIDRLQPISFDKVFRFETFNDRCGGFLRLGRYSELMNSTAVLELQKGSGRRWTVERDLDQLRECRNGEAYDGHEVVRIVGKNPFLWHDHWPVGDYARVFECLVLVDEYMNEADRVVSRIREVGEEARRKLGYSSSEEHRPPYVAVHMRIEIDWMIHCKKMERRYNVSEICSSKEEITVRVGNIVGLSKPVIVYLAVADNLLEDGSILSGWGDGLIPYEKNKLGVNGIYEKYPYLIKSAIDYEVCSRADIFVGNSFSTFSSLIVLERTQKMINIGVGSSCKDIGDAEWPSYAYNVLGQNGGPHKWMTNMSDTSLNAISYGSNKIAC